MPDLRFRGRGRGGKSHVTLDLIDHYWDQIEGDFFDYGWDARDWVRGERPWSQFLNYCNRLANRKGSQLRAAQLNDDRFNAEVELLMEEQSRRVQERYRPPMEGFTAEVQALYDVANDIRLLINAMAQAELDLHEGPETPADRIAKRRSMISLSKIAEITA